MTAQITPTSFVVYATPGKLLPAEKDLLIAVSRDMHRAARWTLLIIGGFLSVFWLTGGREVALALINRAHTT